MNETFFKLKTDYIYIIFHFQQEKLFKLICKSKSIIFMKCCAWLVLICLVLEDNEA